MKNFNVSVKEIGDKILFMRTLKAGGSEHSFGIHVAQIAGMPNRIVLRASEILKFLEKERHKNEPNRAAKETVSSPQMDMFAEDPRFTQIRQLLEKTDINTISPVEALLKLNELLHVLKK